MDTNLTALSVYTLILLTHLPVLEHAASSLLSLQRHFLAEYCSTHSLTASDTHNDGSTSRDEKNNHPPGASIPLCLISQETPFGSWPGTINDKSTSPRSSSFTNINY